MQNSSAGQSMGFVDEWKGTDCVSGTIHSIPCENSCITIVLKKIHEEDENAFEGKFYIDYKKKLNYVIKKYIKFNAQVQIFVNKFIKCNWWLGFHIYFFIKCHSNALPKQSENDSSLLC